MRLPADFALPAAPAPVTWTASSPDLENDPIEFDWAKETVRHAGIVVHAWLQRIAEDQLKGWDAKRVDGLKPQLRRDLQRRGVSPTELDRAEKIVTTALKNTLSDERGRWILGPHPVAINERRMRAAGRSYRIDRYLEDARGEKWVVDYKTSAHQGTGVDTFLDSQRARYLAQLNEYSVAVGGATCGLYFPLQVGWRTWE
jgi:ATP-dependent exoDNAse (exonuclease V) beta subunit